jgi:hypothetical protein
MLGEIVVGVDAGTCSLGVELDFGRIPTRSLDGVVCKVCGFVGCVAIPNE